MLLINSGSRLSECYVCADCNHEGIAGSCRAGALMASYCVQERKAPCFGTASCPCNRQQLFDGAASTRRGWKDL